MPFLKLTSGPLAGEIIDDRDHWILERGINDQHDDGVTIEMRDKWLVWRQAQYLLTKFPDTSFRAWIKSWEREPVTIATGRGLDEIREDDTEIYAVYGEWAAALGGDESITADLAYDHWIDRSVLWVGKLSEIFATTHQLWSEGDGFVATPETSLGISFKLNQETPLELDKVPAYPFMRGADLWG